MRKFVRVNLWLFHRTL
ncbi:hypothetical protein Patl1_25490 [Pistacia atlantica]|uniref:Uncharacterized protein n=1 Tax=Pistacia atlantica TaxID=434234 RepID=A0ACC1B4E5_9ROSI|nr:hypothetical protein Patl1_25490 [Pistacia atlantica]